MFRKAVAIIAALTAASAAMAGGKPAPKPAFTLPPSYVSDPGVKPPEDPEKPDVMTLAGHHRNGQYFFGRNAAGQANYELELEAATAELEPKLAQYLKARCNGQPAEARDCTFMLKFNVAACQRQSKENERAMRILTRCQIKNVRSLLPHRSVAAGS